MSDQQSAFPTITTTEGSMEVEKGKWRPFSMVESSGGLTKREYFAAAAMQGLVAGGGKRPISEFIKEAYDIADAMLKEAPDDQR